MSARATVDLHERGEVTPETGGEAPERRIHPELARVYAPHAIAAAPRLLGALAREPDSASFGDFDREHWGWKFRDHPLGMLQVSVYPLALLWRYPLPDNPYHDSPRLRDWLAGAFGETLDRQHANGAFSAFVPNEQDAMSTVAIMHGLTEAYGVLCGSLPPAVEERFLSGLRRACDFALERDETHGFVSNHQALFAVAFHDAWRLLGDDRCRVRAEAIVDRILERQSAEGWYDEYGGPDPGYETLGLFHGAMYWRRTGSERMLASLRRSVEFHAHGVHPDGSVGGVYGSRHTSLYLPAGLEILAPEIPMAAATARFMRARLDRGNVVTPGRADIENLPPLTYGYLEACFAPDAGGVDAPPLPCQTDRLDRTFPDSGIVVASRPRYYAVANGNKGGVVRIFDRSRETVAYEDAGYIVRSGGKRFTSQHLGLGSLEPDSPGEATARTILAELRQEMPTPLRMIVLRLLNLTLFRHPGLGNWLRKQIAVRLILSRREGPYTLDRRFRFGEEDVEIEDTLRRRGGATVDEVRLPRALTAIHMGSARYFHPSELRETPAPALEGLVETLNARGEAAHAFRLVFEGDAPVRLVAASRTFAPRRPSRP